MKRARTQNSGEASEGSTASGADYSTMSDTRDSFTFVDLFAGIGGFHHALKSLGGECVMASEIDESCQKVYRNTFPDLPAEALVGDIRGLTRLDDQTDRSLEDLAELVPDHDVLAAGFPCQPFSKSGAQRGIADKTRGTLFFDIMRIVKAKNPRYIILENVRNLAGPRHRDTFATIITQLRDAGYRVSADPVILSPHLLSPDDGGSPQHRERVFVLAEHVGRDAPSKDLDLDLVPSPGWDPAKWDLSKVLQDDDEIADIERYRLSSEDEAALQAWQGFVQMIPSDDLPGFPIWSDYFVARPTYPKDAPDWKRDFIDKNRDFYSRHKEAIDKWKEIRWGKSQFHLADLSASRRRFEWQARAVQPKQKDRDLHKLAIQFRPSGVRVKPLNYLPTLVAITQTSYIGPKGRYLTPTEAARLQGFPPSTFAEPLVNDKDAYKQAGNAVHVGVARYAAQRMFEVTGAPWHLDKSSASEAIA